MKKPTAWLCAMPLVLSAGDAAMAGGTALDSKVWEDFDFALGFEVSLEPDYQGSDDYELDVFPLLQVTYKDWLYLDSLAAGAIWALPRGFRLQTGISYEEGRESGDNDALDGLDDIKDTAVLDAGLFYDIGDLTLGFALEQDLLGRGKGLVTFLGAKYSIELMEERLEISPQIDISFANARHLQTEFGISAEEAAQSQFDAYRPGAGLKSYGVGTGVDFKLTEHWTLIGEAGIEFYGPEAKDSPLLDEAGADYGAELELALVYRF